MLRRFARRLKWPGLDATLGRLARLEREDRLQGLGAEALAFFSGLVLPGVSARARGRGEALGAVLDARAER